MLRGIAIDIHGIFVLVLQPRHGLLERSKLVGCQRVSNADVVDQGIESSRVLFQVLDRGRWRLEGYAIY